MGSDYHEPLNAANNSTSHPRPHLLAAVGIRPNFVKIAPLWRAFGGAPDIALTLVHTAQHYDDAMYAHFLRDLGLPRPNHDLGAPRGSHAYQTAEIMTRFEGVLLRENPTAVLVAGDANSTLACALVAKKLNFFLIHVEAGLRSFDRSMPEEINRLAVDAISDLLLASEESGVRNLEQEGVPKQKIAFVGNLMIDSLRRHLPDSKRSEILGKLGLRGKRFGLLTLHRPANVDHPQQFDEILSAARQISAELPLVFPVHPRTRARMESGGAAGSIRTCEPLGYLDFLCLMSHSAAVLTDSGGVQEETTALGVPCLTLRDNTERPSTIEHGSNRLAGTSRTSILQAWEELRAAPPCRSIPALWDGKAAERCVQAIRGVL